MIYISLIANEVEHLFMCLLAVSLIYVRIRVETYEELTFTSLDSRQGLRTDPVIWKTDKIEVGYMTIQGYS